MSCHALLINLANHKIIILRWMNEVITWMDEVRWARSPDTLIRLRPPPNTPTHPTQKLKLKRQQTASKQRTIAKRKQQQNQSEGKVYKHQEEAGSPGRWRRLRHPATAGCLCTATCSSTSFSPAAKSFSTRWSNYASRFSQFFVFWVGPRLNFEYPLLLFTSIAFATPMLIHTFLFTHPIFLTR